MKLSLVVGGCAFATTPDEVTMCAGSDYHKRSVQYSSASSQSFEEVTLDAMEVVGAVSSVVTLVNNE